MRAGSENSYRAALDVLGKELEGTDIDAMAVAENLFGLADVMREEPKVPASLTDPGRHEDAKAKLATDLVAGAVEPTTVAVLQHLARGTWSDPADLAVACEDLGTEAVFAAANEAGCLEQVERELFAVNAFLSEQRELRINLSDLGVGSAHDRAHFAARLFAPAINPYTSRLVRRAVRLAVHGRLTSRLRELVAQAATKRGQMVATVTTAQPLSSEQMHRLHRILVKRYGREISINPQVDPSILGGINVQVGQQAIAATVKANLEKAKRELAH